MRKLAFILLAFAVVAITACRSGNSSSATNDTSTATSVYAVKAKPTPPSAKTLADDSVISAYIKANKIDAKLDSASGVYYQILSEGPGEHANIGSIVNVAYEGKLLNGTQFDKSPGALPLRLSQMIRGWQIGIPLVKAGGKILLIIPSDLGYGPTSPGDKIPPNSILMFTVEVYSIR